VRSLRAALVGLGLALAGGCAPAETRFPIVITVTSDDGKPLPGVAVTVGQSPPASTDADGKVRQIVPGQEGTKVPVAVALPRGYRLPGPPSALVLRRLNDVEHGRGHLLPVEETVQLAPLQRRYAVLVRVGVAGLPVVSVGTRLAVTHG
jgi:hypothetical protein